MFMWDRYGFHKERDEICYAEFVFLHLVGSVGHVLHCGASGASSVDALFFLLGWDQIILKRVATPYAELVFLHPVVSAGHVVHSGAFGA
jgi:hypothetical protein